MRISHRITLARGEKKHLAILGTLALLAWTMLLFRLNYRRIYDNTFWLDENWSIRLARMPLAEMLRLTAQDVHPPLYYLLVMAMNRLFGDNGPAYHLSALLPYMGILLLACTEVRKNCGMGAALVLVTMSSLMPEPLYYNVEARMYSLGAFLVLAAYLSLRRILTGNRLPAWICFSLASLGAAYTHYYALIAVAFFYLILVVPSVKDKTFRRRTAATWAAAVVGYLPWLGVLVKSFAATSGSWWLNTIPTVRESIRFFFNKWYLSAAFFLIAGAYVFLYGRHRPGKQEEKAEPSPSPELLWVLAGLLAMVGTVAVGLVLSWMVRPFFLTRYLYPLTPVAFLLMGFCLSRIDRTRLLTLVLTAGIVVAVWPSYIHIRDDAKYLDMRTAEFLTQVQPEKNAAIYTENTADFRYYFPDIPEYTNAQPEDLKPEYGDIWYFRVVDEEPEDIPGYTKEKITEGIFTDWITYYLWRYQAKQGS